LRRIYKLMNTPAWEAAQTAGEFLGSADDERDGFIHFSDGEQVQETARLYFKGQADLVLLTVDADRLGEGLKWEVSRGGALFPHLFGPMPVTAVIDERDLELDADGTPVIGPLA